MGDHHALVLGIGIAHRRHRHRLRRAPQPRPRSGERQHHAVPRRAAARVQLHRTRVRTGRRHRHVRSRTTLQYHRIAARTSPLDQAELLRRYPHAPIIIIGHRYLCQSGISHDVARTRRHRHRHRTVRLINAVIYRGDRIAHSARRRNHHCSRTLIVRCHKVRTCRIRNAHADGQALSRCRCCRQRIVRCHTLDHRRRIGSDCNDRLGNATRIQNGKIDTSRPRCSSIQPRA